MDEIVGLFMLGIVCLFAWVATMPDPRTKEGDRRGRRS